MTAGTETIDPADAVRLAIVRRAEAFKHVRTMDRAFSKAARSHHDADYPDDGESRHAVLRAFFAFCDAGRAARAADADLDRQLYNVAREPLPDEVLP